MHKSKVLPPVHALWRLGCPKDRLIGRVRFPTYQTPLCQIFSAHDMTYYLYTDDTQVHIAFNPLEEAEAAAILERCIADVSQWMRQNVLKLNHSKTGYLAVGPKSNLQKLHTVSSLNIGDCSVDQSRSVRNIGARFDALPTHKKHWKIRPYLTAEISG